VHQIRRLDCRAAGIVVTVAVGVAVLNFVSASIHFDPP
jgi:hypothetical protein